MQMQLDVYTLAQDSAPQAGIDSIEHQHVTTVCAYQGLGTRLDPSLHSQCTCGQYMTLHNGQFDYLNHNIPACHATLLASQTQRCWQWFECLLAERSCLIFIIFVMRSHQFQLVW